MCAICTNWWSLLLVTATTKTCVITCIIPSSLITYVYQPADKNTRGWISSNTWSVSPQGIGRRSHIQQIGFQMITKLFNGHFHQIFLFRACRSHIISMWRVSTGKTIETCSQVVNWWQNHDFNDLINIITTLVANKDNFETSMVKKSMLKKNDEISHVYFCYMHIMSTNIYCLLYSSHSLFFSC